MQGGLGLGGRRTVAAAVVALGVVVVLGWLVAVRSSSPEPGPRPLTFGDLMHPVSTDVLGRHEVTATLHTRPPRWERDEVRWDAPDAFTYSLTPHALGSHEGDATDPRAAEFFLNNTVAKVVDVSFVVSGGRRFAIHYKTYRRSEARVWLDDRPVSSTAFYADEKQGTDDWLEITLPREREVTVRFEGPTIFSGVDYPTDDPVTVTAPEPPFTMGVVSDSLYEPSPFRGTTSRSADPTFHNLTGFRVWNMAQGGTGYLNAGVDPPLAGTFDTSSSSPFGSEERLRALDDAPIDALLVNGSLNDGPPFTVAQFRDAVDRFLTEVEMRRPTLPVVLVGIEPISTSRIPDTPTPQYLAMTRVLRQAAAEHDNVVGFIDTYTGNWFTGTGSTKHPRGDGNQDRYIGADGVHPNGAGQELYQGRVVAELRKLPVHPRDAHPAR